MLKSRTGLLDFLDAEAPATPAPAAPQGSRTGLLDFLDAPAAPSRDGAPADLASLADSIAQRHGVPPDLFRRLVHAESGWNPRAVSPVGAQGLSQLMPGTARDMGVRDPFDPAQNLEGGARYLRMMLDRYGGNAQEALAAYNAGPGRVKRGRGVPNIPETRAYVARILGGGEAAGAAGAALGASGADARQYGPPNPNAQYGPPNPRSKARAAVGPSILNPLAAPAVRPQPAPQPDPARSILGGFGPLNTPPSPPRPSTLLDVGDAAEADKRARDRKPLVEWQGQQWRGDPFESLPFTREAFQHAVNEGGAMVRTKAGALVPYTRAALSVTKKTGVRDFKATQGVSEMEEAQTMALAPDVPKAQNAPTGLAAKDARENYLYKDGRPRTQADRNNQAMAEVRKAAEDAGVPSLLTDVALMPADFGTDFRRVFDPAEPADKRAGAAVNVLVGAATSEIGGRVLSKMTAPARAALMESFRGSKAGRLILGAKDSGEAINAAMERLKVSRPEAERIVEEVAKTEPVRWKPVSGNHSDRPIPTKGAKPPPVGATPKPPVEPVPQSPLMRFKPDGEPSSIKEPSKPPQAQKEAETLAPSNTRQASEAPKGGNLYDPAPEPIVPPAKPRQGVKPEPVRPRTGEEPFVGPTTETPEKFAASNAASDDLRRSTGLGELLEAAKTDVDPATAAGTFDHDATLARARKIVRDVSEGKKAPVLTHEEQLHFGELEASVGKRYNETRARLAKAYEEGSDSVAGLEADLIRHREDVDAATLANKHVGSEQARAFGARNKAYDDELTAAGQYRSFTLAKKGRLDPKQAEEAERLGAELEKSQARVAELEAAREAKAVEAHVGSLRSKKPRTVEQIRAGRADTKARLSQKWEAKSKELAGQANATLPGVTTVAKLAHVAPEVLELVKSYADEGVVKLAEVVAKVHADLKESGIDAAPEDVEQIVRGDYARPKREVSKTTAEQQVIAWRKELREAGQKEKELKAQAARTEQAEADRIAKQALKEETEAVRKATAEALEADRAAAKAEKAERSAEKARLDAADREARKARREDVKAAVREDAGATRQAEREARAAEREETRKAARETAYWDRIARGLEERKATAEAQAARREQQKAFAELKAAARKEAQAERRARAKAYEEAFGERSRLEANIAEYERKIRESDFETKKRKERDPELQDAYVKLEALKVEASARRAAIENEQRLKEMGLGERAFKEVANLPRALVATLDASAPLNQGAFAMWTHPVMSIRAVGHMIAAARNEGALFNALGRVRANEHYEAAIASGLQLSAHDALDPGGDLFLSKLLGHPVGFDTKTRYGAVDVNPIAASERAYSAYLNKLRMDMFAQAVDKAEKSWGPFKGRKLDQKQLKELADWVNVATGAGTGKIAQGLKGINQAAPIMFAPGYMVSRWQLAFGPLTRLPLIVRRNPRVAALILQDYSKFALSAGGIMLGLNAAGYKVEMDPRSSNFMKAQTEGGTTIDPFSGIFAPLRVTTQVFAGSKTANGERSADPSVSLGYYATGKAAPILRTLFNVARKEAFGKSFDPKTGEGWKNIGMSLGVPIQGQAQLEIGDDKKLTAEQNAALRILTFFGASVQSPKGGAEK